jgi:hypothetical protein
MNDPTPPQAAPPAPTVMPLVEPHTHSGLSPTEAASMADWARQDVASGKLSPEAATKLFDDLGVPADQRVLPPDPRTDEQRLIEAQFPAAKPEDYRITYADPGQIPPPMTSELHAFDASARTWMSGAGMPRELGNSLVNTISKVAQHTQHMTPDQLESYGYSEFERLQKAHGPALDEKLNAAGRMVHELDTQHPGLKNLLKSNRIGDSAMVASILIQHASIYHARKR